MRTKGFSFGQLLLSKYNFVRPLELTGYINPSFLSKWKENSDSIGNEQPHDKTNKMACAPSEDSDQPGHPPSLIRVLALRSMDS